MQRRKCAKLILKKVHIVFNIKMLCNFVWRIPGNILPKYPSKTHIKGAKCAFFY